MHLEAHNRLMILADELVELSIKEMDPANVAAVWAKICAAGAVTFDEMRVPGTPAASES